MSKLKKKILLTLLRRSEQSAKQSTKSSVKYCSVGELVQMIYPELRDNPYSDWGKFVSIRRELESLRKQGLILKSHNRESKLQYRGYNRGRHWKATLTEKGVNATRPMKEEILDYISEWFEYVTAIQKTEKKQGFVRVYPNLLRSGGVAQEHQKNT
jgi:hypothetical protein